MAVWAFCYQQEKSETLNSIALCLNESVCSELRCQTETARLLKRKSQPLMYVSEPAIGRDQSSQVFSDEREPAMMYFLSLSKVYNQGKVQLGPHFAVLRRSYANNCSYNLRHSMLEASIVSKIVDMGNDCQKRHNRLTVASRSAVTVAVKGRWIRFRRSTALSNFCRSAVLDPPAVNVVANSDYEDKVSGFIRNTKQLYRLLILGSLVTDLPSDSK